jgi:fructose-1,6-bisphosphatase
VLEFVLSDKRWRLRRVHTKLGDKNNVAPANIRAAAGNEAYQQLLHAWITNGCKLRYSGGMVPDVHHMLAKVGRACGFKAAGLLSIYFGTHYDVLA